MLSTFLSRSRSGGVRTLQQACGDARNLVGPLPDLHLDAHWRNAAATARPDKLRISRQLATRFQKEARGGQTCSRRVVAVVMQPVRDQADGT